MTKPYFLALDFDGVQAETCNLAGVLLGQPYDPETVTSYSMVYDMFGAERFREGVQMAHRATDQLEPVVGAIEGIKRLMALPNVVCYTLTANDADCIPHLQRWQRKHGIEMPVVTVGVGGSKGKGTCRFDLIVDDHPDLLHHLTGQDAIGFARPYNSFSKFNTWENIPDIVEAKLGRFD